MADHTACVTYVLRDPVSKEIRYVGLTLDPWTRGIMHASTVTRPKSPLQRWKNRLHRRGLKPVFQVCQCFPDYRRGSEGEQYAIQYHARQSGPRLLNREHNPLFVRGKFVGCQVGSLWYPQDVVDASPWRTVLAMPLAN